MAGLAIGVRHVIEIFRIWKLADSSIDGSWVQFYFAITRAQAIISWILASDIYSCQILLFYHYSCETVI